MALPINQIPVGEGMLSDGTRVTFYVDRQTVDKLIESGQTEKLDDSRFLPEAVSKPDAIFTGLRRPNQQDGLCYSVRPVSDPEDENGQDAEAPVLPRYGVAFLAFVQVGAMGYVVFDWEWRDEDLDNPGHPVGWSKDFAKKVYP